MNTAGHTLQTDYVCKRISWNIYFLINIKEDVDRRHLQHCLFYEFHQGKSAVEDE